MHHPINRMTRLGGPLQARKAILTRSDLGSFSCNFRPYAFFDDRRHDRLDKGPAEVRRERVFEAVAAGPMRHEALQIAFVLADAEGDLGERRTAGAQVTFQPPGDALTTPRGIAVIFGREPRSLTHQCSGSRRRER